MTQSPIGYRVGLLVVALGLAFTAFAACGAQVPPQYQGEPLATLHGAVVTQSTAASSDVSAAIVWVRSNQASAESYPQYVGTKVPVAGTFPANFAINLYTPPPPEGEEFAYDPRLVGAAQPPALDSGDCLGGGAAMKPSGAWLGVLVALAPDASGDNLHPGDILGVDAGHVVLYFDHDETGDASGAQAWSPADLAQTYMVPATKGYHMATIARPLQDQRDALLRCLSNGMCSKNDCAPFAEHCSPGMSVSFYTEWGVNMNDWYYGRCVQASPAALICQWTCPDGAPMATTDAQCQELATQTSQNPPDCSAFPVSSPIQANPNGFDDPCTIVLGTSIWDALYSTI